MKDRNEAGRFLKEKKDCLGRADKSNRGSIDKRIKKLVDLINKKDDFYTTSSCAGRIVLLKVALSGKKCDTEQMYLSHEPAKIKEVLSALPDAWEDGEEVLFKMQSFILHVCCRDVESLKRLFRACVTAGIKKYGAIPSTRGFIAEIAGSEKIELPLPRDLALCKKILPDLIKDSNRKLKKNFLRIKKLEIESGKLS